LARGGSDAVRVPGYHRRQELVYRAVAPLYDALIYPHLWPIYRAGRSLLGDARGLTALDAGTGTGNFAFELASHGASVTGIDISPSLLAVAKRKAARRVAEPGPGCGGGTVGFHLMSATDLDFPDRSFDYSVAAMLLHELPSGVREQALGELTRVARRGVLIIDFGRTGQLYWGTALIELLEGSHCRNYLSYPLEERAASLGFKAAGREAIGQFEVLLLSPRS